MDSTLNLLSPLKESFSNGDIETQLKSLFIDVFETLFTEQISDIHYYGMAHLGSPTVVERFTKQDGLVVLRRPDSSDLIMRIIYANWKSLGSKRGLSFIEFVLQMLLGDHWKIQRLYHSKERADRYPSLALPFKNSGTFLTSRIMIDLDQTVDFEEMLELSPTLFRMVPANIVPTLSSSIDLTDIDNIHIAIGFIPYMVADFQYINLNEIYLPATNWIIGKYYRVSLDGQITFYGTKSDGTNLFQSTAVIDMKPHVLNQLSVANFQNTALMDRLITSIYGKYIGAFFDNNNSILEISSLPDQVDYMGSMAVILSRFSSDPMFSGRDNLETLITYFDWFIEDDEIRQSTLAPPIMTSLHMYVSEHAQSYTNYENAAKAEVQYLKQNVPAWANRELLELRLELETETYARYVQTYLESSVQYGTVITVEKMANPDFVDENATANTAVSSQDLLECLELALDESALDEDLLYLSKVVSDLVVLAHEYDAVLGANTLFDENKTAIPYTQFRNQIISSLSNLESLADEYSREFIISIASTVHEANVNEQIVKASVVIPLFELNPHIFTVSNANYLTITNIDTEVLEYAE